MAPFHVLGRCVGREPSRAKDEAIHKAMDVR